MMRVGETVHTFAGNPIVGRKQDAEKVEQWLKTPEGMSKAKVLLMLDGKPLVSSSDGVPWQLAWQALEDLNCYESEERVSLLVYLGDGDGDGASYFAIGVPGGDGVVEGQTFFDLRSLMQASDYGDESSMQELSVAGHARAMLEWHKKSLYCGLCGSICQPILCGQRRQCTKCNNKVYPRTDPAVIMLVIDKERDSVILGRASRFIPRMWSCLAGFIEPGESLEEAVRRETREEVGLEIGDIVYHSSQPWPVGPASMSCQLMVGFFAYAKTFDIRVDKKELDEAQWHRREDVRKLLQNTKYKRDQQEAIVKIQKAASGGESATEQRLKTPSDVPELSFLPGPYAIAHHLISAWADQGSVLGQSNI